jgi:outer membrane murein-binding lipoprotein Lpp
MKARNREINIFNMSLLDILCGALGAFCFLMLTLFPYYGRPEASGSTMPPKPIPAPQPIPGAEIDPAALGKYAHQVKQLQQHAQQLQQQVQQLRTQLQTSEQSRADTQQKLDNRNPATVQVWWSGAKHDVDVYVRETYLDKQQKHTPPFDPGRKQKPFWPGDIHLDSTAGPGSESWMLRDMPPGEYHVFYKLVSDGGNPQPSIVNAQVMYGSGVLNLSEGWAILGPQRRSMFAGALVVDKQRAISFNPSAEARQATQQVRQMAGVK